MYVAHRIDRTSDLHVFFFTQPFLTGRLILFSICVTAEIRKSSNFVVIRMLSNYILLAIL